MRYVLKKTATTLITLAVVSLLLFVAFSLISGDPATRMLGTGATPERLEALREELGLNEALPIRYVKWLVSFVQGDPGISYVYKQPVASLLSAKVPVTLSLTIMSFVLVCAIGFPLGIYTGKYAGSALDRAVMVLNQVIMAVPPFFSGILISHIHPAAVDRETDVLCPRYYLVFFSTEFEVHAKIHHRSNGDSGKIGQVFLRNLSKGCRPQQEATADNHAVCSRVSSEVTGIYDTADWQELLCLKIHPMERE